MLRLIGYVVFSLVLIVLHTTLGRFLAIRDIAPDVLLIWIVYIAIRHGQVGATAAGFLIGLTVDLLSGQDGMLGLSALSKTLAGFCAGYFYNENKVTQTLGGYQSIIIVAITALLHNLIYFIIFLQGTDIVLWSTVVGYSLPSTAYTTALSLLPMFIFARKYSV